MWRLVTLIGLSVGFACGRALGAEDIPLAAEAATPVVSPELATMLTDWEAREAQIPSGSFEWRVVQQIRSPTLGVLSVVDDTREAKRLRTQFDVSGFRLEGGFLPAPLLSRPPTFSSLPTTSTPDVQFRAAMAARFALPIPVEKPQPYTVFINSHREVHFWAQEGQAHPSAVVLAAGQQNRSLDDHAAAALHAKLLDALLLAVHPSFGMRHADLQENHRGIGRAHV